MNWTVKDSVCAAVIAVAEGINKAREPFETMANLKGDKNGFGNFTKS